MDPSTEILIGLAIIALVTFAALVQRITGLGFAMVSAPFLVVLLGPLDGVLLTNFLGLIAPLIMLIPVWKHVEWGRALSIGIIAVVSIPFFGWVAANTPAGPLYIVVASLVLVSLSLSVILSRLKAVRDSYFARTLAGVGTGAGAVIAGVGGPAMTVYGVLTKWDVVPLAATLQPIWVLVASTSLTTKWVLSEDGMPELPWWVWAGCVVTIVIGLWLGGLVQKRVSPEFVRKVVIVMAFLGALLALITGIQQSI